MPRTNLKQSRPAVARLSEIITIFVVSFTCFGLLSIYFRQDINWDLRNYHFYVGYALLKNRLFYDFSAAQIQTFHNPLLFIPSFWLIQNLNPKAVGFILGGIQGINFCLCYLVAKSVLVETLPKKTRIIASLLLALASTLSPLFLSELGTSFGDNITSLFVLTGVLLILRWPGTQQIHSSLYFSILFAGICFGFAGGLKLTNLIYAFAATLSLFAVSRGIDRLVSSLQSLAGIVIGFALSSGYWMLFLFKHYKNPLFPYYNSIFHSPYFSLSNFKDERWIPKSIAHALSYPFDWVVARNPSSEIPFRDLRWAIAIILLVALIICLLIQVLSSSRSLSSDNETQSAWTKPFARKIITIYASSSFFIWLFQFGYSRYLIPLDLISSIYILCLLDWLSSLAASQKKNTLLMAIAQRKVTKIFAFFIFSIVLVFIQVPDWGRSTWKDSWFGVSVPKISSPSNSIVLMLGSEPMSYVIPYFPAAVKFLRVQGNLFQDPRWLRGTLLEDDLDSRIRSHKGSFYVLSPAAPGASLNEIVSIHNVSFRIDLARCTKVVTSIDEFKLCKAAPAL